MFTEGLTYSKTITMVTVSCCQCGCVFGIPSDLNQKFMDDGNMCFHCPNGHKQHYSKDTVAKLREELEKEKAEKMRQREYRERAEESLRKSGIELKKNKTKLRNIKIRVANGVCPCCNRTFVNLQRHMHTKHPEFTPSDEQPTNKD